MAAAEVALMARARGLSRHLLRRAALETLADADDLDAFASALSRLGAAIDPIGDAIDVFTIERAIGRTASRHLRTLSRWEERTPGVLDVWAADQDRRSLRALLRGAIEGAPIDARLEGLAPTTSLPRLALEELARHASPAQIVGDLVLLAHPSAPRLLPLVQSSHPDLRAIDLALLSAFAERATRAAARGDDALREFVSTRVDVGNAQHALLIALEPRDIDPDDSFVPGGRWLSRIDFVTAARAGSQPRALQTIEAALARSPLASWLPAAANDVAHLDRAWLIATLTRLSRAARLDPLSSSPLLRVLLLIEAQTRDLRALTWGVALGAPISLRKQRLVTPS